MELRYAYENELAGASRFIMIDGFDDAPLGQAFGPRRFGLPVFRMHSEK